MWSFLCVRIHVCTHRGWAHRQRVSTFCSRKNYRKFVLCSWRGLNLGSLGLESDTLPTEPPRHPLIHLVLVNVTVPILQLEVIVIIMDPFCIALIFIRNKLTAHFTFTQLVTMTAHVLLWTYIEQSFHAIVACSVRSVLIDWLILSPANHNDYLRTVWKTRQNIHK